VSRPGASARLIFVGEPAGGAQLDCNSTVERFPYARCVLLVSSSVGEMPARSGGPSNLEFQSSRVSLVKHGHFQHKKKGVGLGFLVIYWTNWQGSRLSVCPRGQCEACARVCCAASSRGSGRRACATATTFRLPFAAPSCGKCSDFWGAWCSSLPHVSRERGPLHFCPSFSHRCSRSCVPFPSHPLFPPLLSSTDARSELPTRLAKVVIAL
jgi:hypothetical protein